MIGMSGVYKLYDDSKRLLYIGKSYDLGSRICTSTKERKAFYYSYSMINNRADTDIYEAYYIAKLTPPDNSVGITSDSPTVVLPDIKFTKIRPVYEDEKVGVAV